MRRNEDTEPGSCPPVRAASSFARALRTQILGYAKLLYLGPGRLVGRV
jgi:hypothetical protein